MGQSEDDANAEVTPADRGSGDARAEETGASHQTASKTDGEASLRSVTPALLRQVFTVALALSSLWVFFCQALLESPSKWFGSNGISESTRVAAIAGVVVCAVGSVAAGVRTLRSTSAKDWLATAARLCGPLVVTGLLPILWYRPRWKDNPISFFVLLGTAALLFEVLLRPCLNEALGRRAALLAWCETRQPLRRLTRLRRARWLRHLAPILLGAGVVFYFVKISELTLLTHSTLQTTHADLAEFDNLFFNALHGHPFRAPASAGDMRDWGGLKTHAEFLLYLLLPLYALKPGAAALLVIQAGVVAATAVPIYALAARRLGSAPALILALSYLLLPAVQQPNFYDFHFTPLGMLCVAWTLYWLDRAVLSRSGSRKAALRSQAILVAFFVAALMSREDVALGMAIAGLIVALWADPKAGAWMLVVGFTYFLVIKFWVMPKFGTMWFPEIYEDLIPKGASGLTSVGVTLVSNPGYVISKLFQQEKIVYVLHLSAPLAFLWVRRPAYWTALLPGIPFTLLATNRAPLYEVSFQYVYHYMPYVFAATVLALEGLASLSRVRMWSAVGALAFSIVFSSQQYGALFGQTEIKGGFSYKRLVTNSFDADRLRSLTKVTRSIPPGAFVASSKYVGPHVSTRLDLVPIRDIHKKPPDFILLGPDAPDQDRDDVKDALKSRDYGVVTKSEGFLLLERGANTRHNRREQRALSKKKR